MYFLCKFPGEKEPQTLSSLFFDRMDVYGIWIFLLVHLDYGFHRIFRLNKKDQFPLYRETDLFTFIAEP